MACDVLDWKHMSLRNFVGDSIVCIYEEGSRERGVGGRGGGGVRGRPTAHRIPSVFRRMESWRQRGGGTSEPMRRFLEAPEVPGQFQTSDDTVR